MDNLQCSCLRQDLAIAVFHRRCRISQCLTAVTGTFGRIVRVCQVDPVAWKLEVERVAPKLRVAVAPDMRDWRQHLEAAHSHMSTLTAAWPDVR